MQIARRVYLYLIAFISLQMLLSGAASLLRLVSELALGTTQRVVSDDGYYRDQVSLWGAVLVVGAVVWAVHWYLAQRVATGTGGDALDERRSILRKLYLYAVLFVALWRVFFAGSALLRQVVLALTASGQATLRDALNIQLPILLVYGLGWAYTWTIRNADNRAVPEESGAATVRRWYIYLVNFGALSVAMWAGSQLAQQIWRALTAETPVTVGGDSLVALRLAPAVGWLVVGAACWAGHWRPTQRFLHASADEQRSVLRKVYLYGVIFQTVAITLTNLAFFLYKLLQLLLGGSARSGIGAGDSLLTAAGIPLLTALVYGVFWAYHWQILAADALLASEEPRQAAIRRIYHYLVAFIGLAVLAVGIVDLVRLLIDFWLKGQHTTLLNREGWGDQISFAATLLIVGAPIWATQWLRLQRQALATGADEERAALVRRIYLLLILFLSVTALLTSAAILLYQLFRNLGATFSGSAISTLSQAAGASLTAGLFLAYHLRALLDDQRSRAAQPSQQAEDAARPEASAPASALVLVQGSDAPAIAAAIAALQRDLPPGTATEAFAAPGVTVAEVRRWLAVRQPAAQRDGHSDEDAGDSGSP